MPICPPLVDSFALSLLRAHVGSGAQNHAGARHRIRQRRRMRRIDALCFAERASPGQSQVS